MRSSGRLVEIVNPMLSDRPTGMGNAGIGLVKLLGHGDGPGAEWYRWINDRVGSRLVRILLRWILSEWIAFSESGCLLVFATHHGPLLVRGRYSVVVHDLICLRSGGGTRMQGFLFRGMVPLIAIGAQQLVAISRAVAGQWNARFGWARRVSAVIPSLSRSLMASDSEGETLARRREGRSLLFVGANYRHKRFDFALDVLRSANRVGMDINIIAVGVDEDLWRDDIARYLAEMGPGSLRVCSFVADDELRRCYQEALCLFFPSVDEGLGFPLLEAASCGCPVLCNDIKVLRETADPFAGFFVTGDIESALEELRKLLDPGKDELIKARQERGRRRVAEFGPSEIKKKWIELVERENGFQKII